MKAQRLKGRRLVAVLVAATAALGVAGCADLQPNAYTMPGQTAVGSDGYTVTVMFNEVANLVPNSAVELNNVVVGTVAGIDVSNWQAKVTLRLLKSADIPSDATFTIGQKTLLGAQYVDVDVPAKPATTTFANNQVVPASQTGTAPSTEQVLGAVALLLDNGGLSQIQTITSQLSTALQTRVPNTRELIRQTNVLLAALNDNKGQIVQALESLNDLASGLASDQNILGTAIDELGPGVKSLEAERQTLVNAVTATARTGAQADAVIEASRASLLQTVRSLQPVLAHLQSVASTLPQALKIGLTVPFPLMTTQNAVRGDYANLFTTLDLRESSLANSWLAGLLTGSSTTSSTASGSTPAAANRSATTPDTTSSSSATPGSSASSGSSSSSGSCLLALLGLC